MSYYQDELDSPLMKRLAEIMPKKPDAPKKATQMMHIEMHPIRMSADSFTAWMKDDLPANREELRAMLLVFGEILNGHMERMLNESNRLRGDLLRTMPNPTTVLDLSDGVFRNKAFNSGEEKK
jgi:hypothetical protein